MSSIVVRPSRLSGRVAISGAKNSALKLLAASLLTKDRICLTSFPGSLLDIQIHVGMLEVLGKRCIANADSIEICQSADFAAALEWHDRSIRNTLLILGALLATNGEASVPLPGGCPLGDRSYDLHVMVLEKFGATVTQAGNMLQASAPRSGLKPAEIILPIRSTGATENALLVASRIPGISRIFNPHIRPEVLDLVALLRKMGANIVVRGQESIIVEGRASLGGAEHEVIADNMEAITWLIAASMTESHLEIDNFPLGHLEIPLIFLRESGVRYFTREGGMFVADGNRYPLEISTGPYPGINSDVQPLLAAFAATAMGDSKIFDLRFAGRYGYSSEMRKLGADLSEANGVLTIRGGNPLIGTRVKAVDLRAGAALLLLGMVAEGETVIDDAWQIARGYNNYVEKLQRLGADVHVL